jgi:hypothetical protein
MRRYKGRASFKIIERDFPHIVEMLVPLGGFGEHVRLAPARGMEDRHGAADALKAAILSPGVLDMPTQPVFSLPSSRHSRSRNKASHAARQSDGWMMPPG